MEAEGLLDEFARWLRIERGATENTVAAYLRDVRAHLIAHPEEPLSPAVLMAAEDADAKAYKPATAARKRAARATFARFRASRGERMEPVPTRTFARRRALPKSLPVRTVERMTMPADATPGHLRDAALIELLAGAGLRVTEALDVRLTDFLASPHELRIDGKGERTRIVPLPAVTSAALTQYVETVRERLKPKCDRLIVADRGGPMRREVAYRAVRAAAARAGANGHVGPHRLRHAYAVSLLERKADLRAVQELLGHASLSTTQVYTELDLTQVKKGFLKAHPRA